MDEYDIFSKKQNYKNNVFNQFYHYKLLRKRNLLAFMRKFNEKLDNFCVQLTNVNKLVRDLQGWFGYAGWANTYKFRNEILKKIYEKSKDLKRIF